MNSPVLTAAIYARVSSETYAIDRQVETLKARVQTDGLTLEAEFTFLDSGYSGASLVRPALERLRHQVYV
jgi:site-specific DNA recombinase